MEEQLSRRPLITVAPLLLNPSELPIARSRTPKGKTHVCCFPVHFCSLFPDGHFLWKCLANKKVFFVELENTLSKVK